MSAAPGSRSHWIRPNHKSGIPTRHLFIRTVPWITSGEDSSSHTWRLGVGWASTLDRTSGQLASGAAVRATEPRSLLEWIGDRSAGRGRTVCWSHGLSYDLRLSDALVGLPELGWEVKHLRIGGKDSVVTLTRDGATLVMTDLHAWIPRPLDHIGRMIGRDPTHSPTAGDRDEDGFRIASEQCETLFRATARILAWLRENDAGNWQPTGAGQAWSLWRHRFYTHRVLAHDDAAVRAAEREALHAGRCEVWRHGRITRTRVSEMDWPSAYAQVSAAELLPSRLLGRVGRPTLERLDREMTTRRVLVRARVETDVPTVPALVEGRCAWPVGTFVTTLWDCELRLALEHGATVVPLAAWTYAATPMLQQWASWAMDLLRPGPDHPGPLIATMVKQQTRTLVGRFGTRYQTWEPYGAALPGAPILSTMVDPEHPGGRDMLCIGGRALVRGGWVEPPDAAPAVLGAVMASVRVRLWRWMAAAGLENVLAVDTDGMLVTPAGKARLEAACPGVLVEKGAYDSVTLRGPRQMTLGSRLRQQGVPGSAAVDSDGVVRFDVWEGLETALRRGRTGSVRVSGRTVQLRGADHRRVHLSGGSTSAREATMVEGEELNRWAPVATEEVG